MEGLSGGVGGVVVGPGGGSSSISSPTSIRAGSGGGGGAGHGDRKRNLSIAGLDSSPGSIDDGGDDDDAGDDRRKTPVVKRACNECRQQKDPFIVCARCQRLKLECKIESNFKRVGKRSKNAEMEREIVELRRQLASNRGQGQSVEQQQPPPPPPPSFNLPTSAGHSPEIYQQTPHQTGQFKLESDEAVASLLDLKQGLDGSAGYLKAQQALLPNVRKVGLVTVTEDRVTEVFEQFFTFYHPFLPILDSTKSPDHYFEKSQLLFWTITYIGARRHPYDPNLFVSLAPEVSKLVWSTLADVPQSYHVVKALCLLCTWPLPISSTSSDATFMLSGIMTHVAMQIGLHRPSHAQDFAKFHVQLRDEELKDRVKTWAACNIVAQSVATGYGQPPQTVYDWTLKSIPDKQVSYQLPEDLEARLRIEKFCDNVIRGLYSNENDPVGLTDDIGRSAISKILKRELEELETTIGTSGSPIIRVHLRAAGLHFHLSAFFDSSTAKDYQRDLLHLYLATTSFLKCALDLETSSNYSNSSSVPGGGSLAHASNYILQMMVAGGFTLLKLLNSFFASHIDLDEGKTLFNQTIWAIRKISIMTNDLPSRLAEVLAQLWRGGGEGTRGRGPAGAGEVDGSLQLKVRCRMSMSLVYDSVWRWREEFQAKGRGNLDSAVKNPTNPDSTAEALSNTSSEPITDHTGPPSSLTPAPQALNGAGLIGSSGFIGGNVTPGPSNSFGESNYEVFDPLNWMLDGFVDWPYTFASGGPLGGQGVEAGVVP